MKLYHYSDKQYTELLTRRVQGADEKEIDIATFKAKRMGYHYPITITSLSFLNQFH